MGQAVGQSCSWAALPRGAEILLIAAMLGFLTFVDRSEMREPLLCLKFHKPKRIIKLFALLVRSLDCD